jgi:hypothetical protein
MEAGNVVEFRKYNRVSIDELYALVDDEIVHVDNISPAGLCIHRPKAEFSERNVHFWVVPLVHDLLDTERAVEIHGHVVGYTGDKVRIVFSSVNYDLAGIIQRYKARSA